MTELEYLKDTYKFESEAIVCGIQNTEKGMAIILDKTIFYPQGGGQPADTGKIISENGTFLVSDVRLDPEGVVYHFGTFQNGSIDIGTPVKLEVDPERRRLNARLHSAGHLIDIAAKKAGLTLKATKGFHFPEGPYVEYEGTVENPEQYISPVNEIANNLIAENILLEKKDLSSEEAKVKNIFAPEGKSARVVNFKGYEEVGCGGTHVENAGEIGKIAIRKISSKKGNTKIAYALV